jgi:hypothetical protein
LALGVTPLGVGQEAYWLDQIARDRCEYYSGKGESPGWWIGSLAERTGLRGVAEEAAVRRLFAGQDPLSGRQRVAPLWRTDPRSRLDSRPLQAALREAAASRGVALSELTTGGRLGNQLQHISSTRKVSAVVVERVCRMVLDRNPEELYGQAYAEARPAHLPSAVHACRSAAVAARTVRLVDGIPVLAASALRPALQVTRQALSPEQVELVAAQVHASFQPAA